MKFKTTKQIKQNYYNIISVGYCDTQHLLQFESPVAYNSGIYGWNYDLYEINGVALITGYRPFNTKRPDYNIIKEYEDKARKIYCSYLDFEEKKSQIKSLLNEFIEKAL